MRKTVLRFGEKNDGPIYLIRWSILTTPWFAVKLHKIFLSDDDCLHDHPWSFISIILRGGYTEVRPIDRTSSAWNLTDRTSKFYRPGSILWRPTPSVHSLLLPEGKTATTLVITFKKTRSWGFITPGGWTHYLDYIRGGGRCE